VLPARWFLNRLRFSQQHGSDHDHAIGASNGVAAMTDRLDRLEGRVDELVAAVGRLEERLSSLEGTSATSTADRAGEPVLAGSAAAGADQPQGAFTVDTTSLAGVLAMLGRAFLVLCGAFLLRGLTEAGVVPQTLGIALGYLYASVWIVLADRAAGAGRTLPATLSGCVASVIAYPLLWEATSRFSLLAPDRALAGVALFSALALAVAWRRRLRTLAAVVTLAALVTDIALMVTHRTWGPAAVVALSLAAFSVWAGYLRGWPGIRWPVALGVDVLPAMMISDAIRGMEPGIPPGPPTATVLAVEFGFIALYLGSFALAMLGLRRRVGAFEVVQGIAVLVAGFAAVHHFLNAVHVDDRWFGIFTLLAGLVCYGTAFVFVDRRFGRGSNFIYFASLALVLSIGGLATAASASLGVSALCGFAVIAAFLGARFDRITLRSHSAVYLAAAALLDGTVTRVLGAYLLPPASIARQPELTDLLVIAAAIVCYLAVAIAASRRSGGWLVRVPDFVIVSIALVGVGGVMLMVFTEIAGRSGPVRAASVAAARSVIIALAAVGAAALGSLRDDRALRWLVYPLLVLCGLKLLVEDLRHGRPTALFVAFAAFGISLIVAPRLLRSAAAPPPDGGGPQT